MFITLSIVFLIVFLLTFFFQLIKQPILIPYILSGIIISNFLISDFKFQELISILAEIGVALMLFIVGLELKLKNLKEIGVLSGIIGSLQEIFTIAAGVILALLLKFNLVEAFYLGCALSFSSTIIMVKLISDKGDLEKFYGKLAVGFLLIQDLITVLIILSLPFLNIGEISISKTNFLIGLILMFLIPFLSYKILPKIENLLSKSKELLFLFSITFVLVVSAIFKYLNIGLEIGALIAGVSLSSLISSNEISFRLRPVRDFFLILFFVYLGYNVRISHINNILFQGLVLTLFVLIFNPIIMLLLLKPLNISPKSSFLLSLTSSQISEFSFILINLGIKYGHIEDYLLSLISFVGLATFLGSTYIFNQGDYLYEIFKKYLHKFYKKKKEEAYPNDYEIILFGCDRIGLSFLKLFQRINISFLVIDYNIEKVKELQELGVNVIYGDASEVDLLEDLKLENVKLIVSTIPDFYVNKLILNIYKNRNNNGIFICTSYNIGEAMELYKLGANYVILPHFLGGEHASHIVEENLFEISKYEKLKEEEIRKLEERMSLGHKHPLKSI